VAKIYTKVGDKGQTSLVGGQKLSKSETRLEAYGTVDELNSVIGLARVACDADGLTNLNADLETIQHWLFDLGGLLASLPADREKFGLLPVGEDRIRWLEERIDSATTVLKPLRDFILPGGSEPAAILHVARTVARRAERHMVEMKDDLPENAIPFINRLSDYFFVMARFCNHVLQVDDVIWKKTKPTK
jgi:cob(I)alamin adenosyltransferase